MNGPTDPLWITAELLGRLFDEHGGALALYAAQWTDSADDCVQEALVELARQPGAPENLRAWLYRVVKHQGAQRGPGGAATPGTRVADCQRTVGRYSRRRV